MSSTIKRNINGILLLNKPYGITSNKALQKIKYLFAAKKAGHAGSLDPMATGVLPIFFGPATKFCQYLLDADKCYIATVKLGISTTTGDKLGEIVEQHSVAKSAEDIKQVLRKFYGESQQLPSMYSALKHKGKKLYEYARKGIEISRPSRTIRINSLELIEYISQDTFVIKVSCSKGTYIRTLAEDIGLSLGTVAHLIQLHRTSSGKFTEEKSVNIEDIEKKLVVTDKDDQFTIIDDFLLQPDIAVSNFAQITIDESSFQHLQQGAPIEITSKHNEKQLLRVYVKNSCVAEKHEFVGLGHIKNNLLYPKNIF